MTENRARTGAEVGDAMTISMPVTSLAMLLSVTQPAMPAQPLADNSTAETQAQASADAANPASTAVKLREVDTRMTVAVMINGAGPFRFIVDSGATRTVISSRVAALLGLPQAGEVSLHSVGGESRVASVRIAALTLGGLSARPLVAPVLDEANLGGAGILGIDALTDKKVVIDLVANRMTIEAADRTRLPAASDEIIVVARRRYGQLVLADAEAAGQKIYAIVDTGSMLTLGNLALRDKLVRRRQIDPKPAQISDVAGRIIEAHFAPLPDLRLGEWHLQDVVIAFSDTHAFQRFGLDTKPAMLLGMDMMRAFRRVSIDFKRRTVRLVRPRGSSALPS